MITHIEGRLDLKSQDLIVVDVGGVGYEIHVPAYLADRLPAEGGSCKIFTHSHYSEDNGTSLYGFLTPDDRSLFRLLLTVSGVGPKVAMGIMSDIAAEDFAEAIVTEDLRALTRISGVGKKTAQRLVLELKDKVASMTLMRREKKAEADTVSDDALDALMALGYTRQQASAAVIKARDTMSKPKVEELIKASLRYL